jgi:Putative adhesin
MTDTLTTPTPPPPPVTPVAPAGPPHQDRPGRAGWWAVGGLLAIVGIVWGTVNLVAHLAHEESDRVTSFPAEGITELIVDSGVGRVEVTGADPSTATITVRAHVTEGVAEPTDRQEVVNGRLELRTDCSGPPFGYCNLAYRISVPSDRAVTITTGDGDVKVVNIDGNVRVESSDGRVELNGLGGQVNVTGRDGTIEGSGLRAGAVDTSSRDGAIRLSFVEAPQSVTARTDDGSITVEVPADGEAYAVDLRTLDGSTSVDVPTDPDSPRTIAASSSDGSVRVRHT